MRGPEDRLATEEDRDEAAALAQGYPSLEEVVEALLEAEDIPHVGVRRLELNAFGSGECTYQVWAVGAEEPVGGYTKIS
jgi:hypothetical protein